MPIRSEWKLAREGFSADTINRFLRNTAFNPAVTLPLVLLTRYTNQGSLLAARHATASKHLKTLLALGLLGGVSSWLSDAVLNNWSNDVYDWSKEIVVVTGGSDGIGKIVVQLLAEKGITVAVLDVQELTYEAPPTVHFFNCDLASPSSITKTGAAVRSALGNPTVLINNAGCARGKTILSTTPKDLNLTFAVNHLSHYLLAQEFLPSMIENNHGLVLTVASLAGYICSPSNVDYAASKSAAITFHEGLAAELATLYKADKVRTVVICQGYTATKLFEGFGGAVLHPETVAEEMVKAVLRGKSAHIVLPQRLAWLGTMLRGLPFWWQYGLRKKLVWLMSGWKGRQVLQPSEAVSGLEKGVGESTVLVEQESQDT